jgi:ABC-type transport system involved in multi-copper enzyme maturation permease subunit
MSTLTLTHPAGRTTTGALTAVLGSTRAELLRVRRWPALWTTVAAELLLNLLFGYVFGYVSYRSGSTGGMSDLPRDRQLAELLPDAIPRVAVQGMPMFAGALVLVLGALVAGNGYSWGTVKTVALQGPGRVTSYAGTLVALAVVVVGLVGALFASDVAASLLVAVTEGQPVVAPGAVDLLSSLGGGVLVMLVWTLAGVIVGTLARGPALAVGLGLVWVLAVENLLRGVGSIWSPMQRVTDVLPGTAAGSLAGAVGATPVSEPGGTPGVLTTLSGGTSVALLVAYAVVFALGTGWLMRRRDIT